MTEMRPDTEKKQDRAEGRLVWISVTAFGVALLSLFIALALALLMGGDTSARPWCGFLAIISGISLGVAAVANFVRSRMYELDERRGLILLGAVYAGAMPIVIIFGAILIRNPGGNP